MQKKSFSWGIIILMLFLFFPVAIFMIVKKMSDEKFNYIKNGKSLRCLGIVLISFAVIYMVMGLNGDVMSNDRGTIIVIIIAFVVGGALSLFKGTEFINRGKKFNRYVSIINASSDLKIDSIARAVPTTYDNAIADIQVMLGAGYFKNAFIDTSRRELLMGRTQKNQGVVINNISNPSEVSTICQNHSGKCSNCGATNSNNEKSMECEYCGSPL